MVEGSGFRDVRDDGSFEDDAVGKALGDEIWEVDGCVDADRRKSSSGIRPGNHHGFGEDPEVRYEVFEPGVRGKEVIEPIGYGTTGIFVAVIDERFWLKLVWDRRNNGMALGRSFVAAPYQKESR